MNKRITFIIVSLIVIILAGYTLSVFNISSIDREDIDEERNAVEKIELTFWRNLGNPTFNRAYEELVSEFEAAHPNIVINMQSMHWGHEYELKLRTELATGNHPDIMAIDSPNLALYANAGALLSLDQYMKEEGSIDDILEATLVGLTFQDEVYLAPIVESSIGLFYNMHLFKEAGIPYPSEDPNNPMTWDEVLEIAKKISNPDKDVYGIDPAQGFGDGEGPAYFKMPILWQFGAEVLSPDASTADGYLNSEEALKALQFYQDLYLKYLVATVELPPEAFETDRLAMTVMGSWQISELETFPDFKLGENFGIAPLPKAKNQAAPNGGWALGISAESPYPDEAWKFINFLTGFEGSKKFVEITGDLPARYSVVNEFPELNEYPKNIFVQQGQNYSQNRPVTPNYSVVSDAMKTLFEDVGIAGKDVKDAADEAVEKINTSLKEIQSQ